MADEFDDLKAAMDAAMPAADPLKKKENIAAAEKTFADLQGSRQAARHTDQTGPIGAVLNGVTTMFNAMTTRAGLTATGLSDTEVDGIMGDNWHRFFAENFGPQV